MKRDFNERRVDGVSIIFMQVWIIYSLTGQNILKAPELRKMRGIDNKMYFV